MEFRDRVPAVFDTLVAEGVLAPVGPSDDEALLWSNCDLAILVEARLHDTSDPRRWTARDRERYLATATKDFHCEDPRTMEFDRAFWILAGTERVGIVALDRGTMGNGQLRVASLYVFAEHRRRSVARRAIERIRQAVCGAGGFGVRIGTSWTWPAAVRFYLGIGAWVHNWKHSLVFVRWNDLPPHRTVFGGDEAVFEIGQESGFRPLIRARRHGDTLEWDELDLDARPFEIAAHAAGTFAMALASNGWPLIRSPAHWETGTNGPTWGIPKVSPTRSRSSKPSNAVTDTRFGRREFRGFAIETTTTSTERRGTPASRSSPRRCFQPCALRSHVRRDFARGRPLERTRRRARSASARDTGLTRATFTTYGTSQLRTGGDTVTVVLGQL